MFRTETTEVRKVTEAGPKSASARVQDDTATANRFGDLIADWLRTT